MQDFNLRVAELKLNELETWNINLDNYIENIPSSVNKDIKTLWKEKQNKIQAGIPTETVALGYLLSFKLDKFDERDISNAIRLFFEDEFKNNILSLRLQLYNNSYNYMITIYPLNGRILKSSPWVVDKKCSHVFFEHLQSFFKDSFHLELKDDLDSVSKKSSKEPLKNVKINKITDMEFPEPIEEEINELIYDAKGLSNQTQSTLSKERIDNLIKTTVKMFTVGVDRMLFKKAQHGEITEAEFMKIVDEYLHEKYPTLGDIDYIIIEERVQRAVFGNDIIDYYLNDKRISDIKIIRPNQVRLKVNGVRMTGNLCFEDDEDYFRFIDSLGIRNNLDYTQKAIFTFTDNFSNDNCIMRFNVSTPYVNSTPYPIIHIRKINKTKYTIDELITARMFDKKIADYLVDKARHGKGLIFVGKGGSGKTTLMNTLLEEIPKNKSGLVIQENEELFSNHPDLMFQHVVHDDERYDLKVLARNGLLTDLDYYIIGEIKGEEAVHFMTAADSGHVCWGSLHAPNTREAMSTAARYIANTGRYNKTEAMYMLKELETIVFMKNFRVAEISEIKGWDEEKKDLIYDTIFQL